jgi:hypothetical protein
MSVYASPPDEQTVYIKYVTNGMLQCVVDSILKETRVKLGVRDVDPVYTGNHLVYVNYTSVHEEKGLVVMIKQDMYNHSYNNTPTGTYFVLFLTNTSTGRILLPPQILSLFLPSMDHLTRDTLSEKSKRQSFS